MTKAGLIYLVVINVVTFVCYGIDKRKAKKGKWRISEAKLLMLAAIGGAAGAWAGMKCFRHKTRHWKFRILVPVLCIAWLLLILWISGQDGL